VIDAGLLEDIAVCGPYTLPEVTGEHITYATYMWRNDGDEYAILPGLELPDNHGFGYGQVYDLTIIVTGRGGCEYGAGSLTLTRSEAPQAGSLGNDQSICYGEAPAELVSLEDGSGSGTVSYRWEQSADGTTWYAIPGANGVSYQPGALTTTMHYRRVTVASANGLTCESGPTAVVTVTVTGKLLADAGEDQTNYHNSTFTLEANTPASGTGSWSVVSTEQPAAFTDLSDPAATVTLLPNTSVTLRWTVAEGDCSVFDEVTLTSIDGADVEVTKTLANASQLSYVPGSDVGYTVTVTNNGPAYAGAVRIQDTAPDGTSIASWTARVEAGTVNLPGTSGAGELDQTIRILPAGATVTYDITLNTSEANTADLVNTVTVSTETDDAVPSNNTAS